MRASQWVNLSAACRIIQNTCEWGEGPGQAAPLSQLIQAEDPDLVTRISRTPHQAVFSAFHWRTKGSGLSYTAGDPNCLKPGASCQKWSCPVLQMWIFLPVLWETQNQAPMLPALRVCMGEGGRRVHQGKGCQLLPHTNQEPVPKPN